MNYKETLYFIGKCLTVSFEDHNKRLLEKQLKSNSIDWDAVVKLSTTHLVFSALYCNLKRANFLQYVPKDLVAYMEHLTQLNRDRNQQIIKQAKRLNTILLAHNITPIFLKGTGNLLAGLYEDIGERMVGDIDFIFSQEAYLEAIVVLRNNGYSEVSKSNNHFPSVDQKHYRRLKKENDIAAIEIHKELLLEKKYSSELNYSLIAKDSQVIKGIRVSSYANKLNLSIVASQINDQGFYFKTIALRNAYDVFLLSKKTNAKDAVLSLQKLRYPLNCFLGSCFEVFNKVASLEYQKTSETVAYLNIFRSHLLHVKKAKRHYKRFQIYFFIKERLLIIYKSLYIKEYRVWVFKRLTGKNIGVKQKQIG